MKAASNVNSNVKDELQAAICKFHGSHTARWLTDTAAACLDVGLEASPSGLQLRPVSIQQVSARAKTHFKPSDDLVAKLRTDTGVKYFTLLGASQLPSSVLLNIGSIITSAGRTTSLSALIQSIQTVKLVKEPLLPAGLDADVKEQGVVGSVPLSAAQPARRTLDVMEARKKLKAAVCQSHPPSAQYLVETAAVCLDHGLQVAEPGFALRPVAWSLVAKTVTSKGPKVSNLLEKLRGKTGQKYFRLLGTTQSGLPEWVTAKLDKLVTPEKSSSVSQLLQQISSSIEQPLRSSIIVSSLAASMAATSLADTEEPEGKMPMMLKEKTKPCSLLLNRVSVVCVFEQGGMAPATHMQAKTLSRIQVYSLDSHCGFDVTKPFPVTTMQSLKALLEDTTVVKILHDSRQPSAALLYQQGIVLQNVFGAQVAQGLLDHMHSVIDPSQWHQRRELGDMLLLHSIEPQAAQADQKHSKAGGVEQVSGQLRNCLGMQAESSSM
ncbi:TPA: Exonuclease 3'-5' [Trebouxia sp. C0004]